MNLSKIWSSLRKKNQMINDLANKYIKKNEARERSKLKGRRSLFFTATEFILPWENRAGGGSMSVVPITKPIVISEDGIYVISRISYEVYFEGIAIAGPLIGTVQREALMATPAGLDRIGISLATAFVDRRFDFEWKLEVGSNERSYSTDLFGGRPSAFMSRETLQGANFKEFQFNKSYFLKGNEFFTLTVRPTNMPTSITGFGAGPLGRRFIISMVTIGHKILGHGHKL